MGVLKPPNSSSLFTFRAAEWAVQINIGTFGSPVWAFLRGLSKFEPQNDPTMQDDSDIDSDGYKSELVTAQKLNVNFEGLLKGEKPGSTVIPDPGMAFMRAKGKEKGYDNIVELRYWRTDDVDEAFSHRFALKFTDVGGSNEDLQKVSGTLSGRGKPTPITKPVAISVNEIQSLTFPNGATGGTFKLKLLAAETAALTFSTLDAATLQTALTGLASIGTGNATVTGSNAAGYTITFVSGLAGVDVPQLIVSVDSLTGGTAPRYAIETLVEGVAA